MENTAMGQHGRDGKIKTEINKPKIMLILTFRARRANGIFPELPQIGVCHDYDIDYKYTYKCTLCNAK